MKNIIRKLLNIVCVLTIVTAVPLNHGVTNEASNLRRLAEAYREKQLKFESGEDEIRHLKPVYRPGSSRTADAYPQIKPIVPISTAANKEKPESVKIRQISANKKTINSGILASEVKLDSSGIVLTKENANVPIATNKPDDTKPESKSSEKKKIDQDDIVANKQKENHGHKTTIPVHSLTLTEPESIHAKVDAVKTSPNNVPVGYFRNEDPQTINTNDQDNTAQDTETNPDTGSQDVPTTDNEDGNSEGGVSQGSQPTPDNSESHNIEDEIPQEEVSATDTDISNEEESNINSVRPKPKPRPTPSRPTIYPTHIQPAQSNVERTTPGFFPDYSIALFSSIGAAMLFGGIAYYNMPGEAESRDFNARSHFSGSSLLSDDHVKIVHSSDLTQDELDELLDGNTFKMTARSDATNNLRNHPYISLANRVYNFLVPSFLRDEDNHIQRDFVIEKASEEWIENHGLHHSKPKKRQHPYHAITKNYLGS